MLFLSPEGLKPYPSRPKQRKQAESRTTRALHAAAGPVPADYDGKQRPDSPTASGFAAFVWPQLLLLRYLRYDNYVMT